MNVVILMRRRSGMTTAACALAKGLSAVLVVPTADDVTYLMKMRPDILAGIQIFAANNRDALMKFVSQGRILVFDDSLRCYEQWMLLGEGDMLSCISSLRKHSFPPGITSEYLFQYAIN